MKRPGSARRSRVKLAPQPHLLELVPEYITRQQAANIAGATTRTVDRWLRDPAVALTPYRRDGVHRRPVLIAREELRALLAVRGVEVESA